MAHIIQPYDIGLVGADVASADVYMDIFYSLERLSSTFDDLFARIEKRTSEERYRVAQINARIEACEKKVLAITGRTTSTTIFSTSKYPAPKILPPFPSLINTSTNMMPAYREADDKTHYTYSDSKRAIVGNAQYLNDVDLYISRINSSNSDMKRIEFIMEEEGIGHLPRYIETVGSLLLFNSQINPYTQYETLDNLASAGRAKAQTDEAKKSLAIAPSSILSGEALPDIMGMDLTHKPQMGVMNNLALPANLPLDFLATDINYVGVDLPSIAPSANRQANFTLPQITYDMNLGPSAKEMPLPPPPSATSAAPPPPPPPPGGNNMNNNSSAPPPPPPPPSGDINSNINNNNNNNNASAAAPPPPMPPPPLQTSSESANNDDDGGGGRNALLDAIKNKKQLRSKDESDAIAEKVEKKAPEKARPLTMAEDLKMRLARRNQALNGKTDEAAKKRDSALIEKAKEQSLSPPPQEEKKKALPSVKTIFGGADDEAPPASKPKAAPSSSSSGGGVAVKTVKKKSSSDSDSDSDDSVLSIEEPKAPASSATKAPFASSSQPQNSNSGLTNSNSGLKLPPKRSTDDSDSDDSSAAPARKPAPTLIIPPSAPQRRESQTEGGFNVSLLAKVQQDSAKASAAAKKNDSDDEEWD